MKKRISAILLACLLLFSASPVSDALYGDTVRSAEALSALGLVQGTGNGYDADAPVTRAQAAVLLVRLAGAESAAAKAPASPFRDVPQWAAPSVNYAAQQGWVKGTSATAFSPDEPVSADAWCTMLLRMLGYQDAAGDFQWDLAALFARHIGLVSRDLSGDLSRGDVFAAMMDALPFRCHSSERTVLQNLMEKKAVPLGAVQALRLTEDRLTARQIADRCMAAVFCISGYAAQADFDDGESPAAEASGFFISKDGLAVTNYHSIDGSAFATATLVTGEVYPIESVVYYDKEIDIAVIRVGAESLDGFSTSAFAFLEVVGTKDIRPGDVVYAIGNPLGLGLAISNGIISDIARDVERYALPCVMNTADISQGSSGGALLNECGQVISVTSGTYIHGNNMYLSVPADPIFDADLSVEGMTLEAMAASETDTADTEAE